MKYRNRKFGLVTCGYSADGCVMFGKYNIALLFVINYLLFQILKGRRYEEAKTIHKIFTEVSFRYGIQHRGLITFHTVTPTASNVEVLSHIMITNKTQ